MTFTVESHFYDIILLPHQVNTLILRASEIVRFG